MKEIDIDYVKFIGKQHSQYVSTKDGFKDKLVDRFKNGVKFIGDTMPWSKTHNLVRFRKKEVTIWAGWNGHGKSYLTGQVNLWLSRYVRTFTASFEMDPTVTIARQCQQAAGCYSVSHEYAAKFADWKSQNSWFYDQDTIVDPDVVLGMINYHSEKDGIEHFFIDSLTKCGIKEDDYVAQTQFIDALCWSAKRNNIHVHLVHHLRKTENEFKRPGKFDLKGSGGISDLADNVILVWRNKVKEKKIDNGDDPQDLRDEPDTILGVEKQRNGEWEGDIRLWLHKASMQYIGKPSNSPMLFELD